MADYRLTLNASEDLTAIADYTLERFGIDRAIAYSEQLANAFELLADNPNLGSDQAHIRENTRRFVSESHQIYYQTDSTGILILRILGPGQDPSLHL